jgi:hypothetical protein
MLKIIVDVIFAGIGLTFGALIIESVKADRKRRKNGETANIVFSGTGDPMRRYFFDTKDA